MLNQLRFRINAASNPYQEEIDSIQEKWGRFFMFIVDNNSQINLLNFEWNILPFTEWVKENGQKFFGDSLESKELGLICFPEESLAQSLKRFQDRDFTDKDEDFAEKWFEALFIYRQSHSLRFAFRGAEIPEIIIGNNNGIGEISLDSDDECWAYQFDIDNFITDLQEEIIHFLQS